MVFFLLPSPASVRGQKSAHLNRNRSNRLKAEIVDKRSAVREYKISGALRRMAESPEYAPAGLFQATC